MSLQIPYADPELEKVRREFIREQAVAEVRSFLFFRKQEKRRERELVKNSKPQLVAYEI